MKFIKNIFIPMIMFIWMTGMNPMAFGQKGEVTEKQPETLQVDALIDAFFTHRTGDLDEMLGMHQIRVLVVPSKSTYFLDAKGQPRGMDYELLKGYEKILNKKRKKGTPPVSVVLYSGAP